MTVDQAHTWARAAREEALRAVELADQILATDSADRVREVGDDLVESATQLRRDAGYVRARIDTEED